MVVTVVSGRVVDVVGGMVVSVDPSGAEHAVTSTATTISRLIADKIWPLAWYSRRLAEPGLDRALIPSGR